MIAAGVKVWVATTPVDMRKSFDALASIVENFLQCDPHGGHLFVFRFQQSRNLLDRLPKQ